MIPPERHAVVHWTDVDHRVARYAAATVGAFLAAAKRRVLRYRAPEDGSQGGVVTFSSPHHVMQSFTKGSGLTCALRSWAPEDSYEITVTMPLLASVDGDPIGDDPAPSLEHLKLFVALASVTGRMLGVDPNGMLAFRSDDERGAEVERSVHEACADMMAVWASSDRTSPRSVKAELPLLDRRGRITRIDEPGQGDAARSIMDEDARAATDHVASTLAPCAVLYKDGPTHFCIRAHSMAPDPSVPDPMETMRRLAGIHARMGSAR